MLTKPRVRLAIVALAVFGVLAIALARHAIVRSLITRVASALTGYEVSLVDQRIGGSAAELRGVAVRSGGSQLLTIDRVRIRYSLHDLVFGGAHRYGLMNLEIAHPIITIERRTDGSYSFDRILGHGGRGAAPSPPPPLAFGLHLRDGEVRIVDRAPAMADLALQRLVEVGFEATIASDARSVGGGTAVFLGRTARGGAQARFPLSLRSTIDIDRGFAIHRLRAASLPLRGPLGFLIHTPAVRFDAGLARGIDVRLFALGLDRTHGPTYRLGGHARLSAVQIALSALRLPIRNLHGGLDLVDDGIASPRLAATVGGIPLEAQGGIYAWSAPRFRLGVRGAGDLATVRQLFGFAAHQPVRGGIAVQTLLESSLGKPLVRTAIDAPGISYARYPLVGLRGVVDYYDGAVSFADVAATFGALGGQADGLVALGPDTRLQILASVHAPAAGLPYVAQLAPGTQLTGAAVVTGSVAHGYGIRGTLATDGAGIRGGGFVAVDAHGQGEFGPFAFERADGGRLSGALRLERPISQSGGWIIADHFPIARASAAAVLPALSLPVLPAFSGTLTGAAIGGGTPDRFELGGHLVASGATYAAYQLGTVSAALGGTLADARLSELTMHGPLGSFTGAGGLHNGAIAVEGQYDGSFEQLAPLTGPLAQGHVAGPVRAIVANQMIALQTVGTTLHGVRVANVPVTGFDGTLSLRGNRVRVVSASAAVGGARVSAHSLDDGRLAVSAIDVRARDLAAAGLPLSAGSVSLIGIATPNDRAFAGAVLVRDGRAAGFPVAGVGAVRLTGNTLGLTQTSASLGSTYALLGGTIHGLATTPGYDLTAAVPLADAPVLLRAVHYPIHSLTGSFGASGRIGGAGRAPVFTGGVRSREASFNGLALHDAAAAIVAAPGSLVVGGGRAAFGGTVVHFTGSYAPRQTALAVQSAHANLADFNDYFDAADTLAGMGQLAVSLDNNGTRTVSAGRVSLDGLRVGRFPLGGARADWTTVAARLRGSATVDGPTGSARLSGSVGLAPGSLGRALSAGRYDATASLRRLDLGRIVTALPNAATLPTVEGLAQADAHIVGRFPDLAVAGTASVTNARVASFPIRRASVSAAVHGSRVELAGSGLDLGYLTAAVSGSVGLTAHAPLDLHAHVTMPSIAEAARRVVPSLGLDIDGALETDAQVAGSFEHPLATAGFSVDHGRYAALRVPSIVGTLKSDGRTLEVEDASATFTRGSAFVAGSLPIVLVPPAIGPARAPLSFTASFTGVDLAPFGPFVPGAGTQLGGTLDGRLAIEGTASAPLIRGTASIAGGSYVSAVETAPIKNAVARLAFNGTSANLQTLHATLGNGTLDGSGELDLPLPNAVRHGYSATFVAKGAQLSFPDFGNGTVDGTLRLVSASPLPILSGDLALTDTVIPFAAVLRSSGGRSATAGAPAATAPLDVAFNVQATAGRNVRVRSSNINIGATGAVLLTGSLSDPRVAGEFRSTRGGIFTTYNQAFRIQEATVTFDPTAGIVPTIDLRATAHLSNPDPDPTRNPIGSADITVTVTGPADGYQVDYASDPPYSREQIIGLLSNLAVLGAFNFASTDIPGTLRGAPGESNALLPPGVTPYQAGSISLSQEAFSVLNAQVAQRFLSPVENVFGRVFDLSDFAITIDYGGGVGYQARRLLSGRNNLYASFGQVLSYPGRTQFGLDARPDAATTASFSYFSQNGTPAYQSSGGRTIILRGIQSLSNRQGFQLTITRKYR